jgi:hypothetical protein
MDEVDRIYDRIVELRPDEELPKKYTHAGLTRTTGIAVELGSFEWVYFEHEAVAAAYAMAGRQGVGIHSITARAAAFERRSDEKLGRDANVLYLGRHLDVRQVELLKEFTTGMSSQSLRFVPPRRRLNEGSR